MMKIRRIIPRFEPFIIKNFGKRSINLNLIDFKIFNSRGRFMNEKWNILHIYFELLNFSISIDYEI